MGVVFVLEPAILVICFVLEEPLLLYEELIAQPVDSGLVLGGRSKTKSEFHRDEASLQPRGQGSEPATCANRAGLF